MNISSSGKPTRQKLQKLLLEAVQHGEVEQARMLISQGANPSEASAGRMDCGMTPLMMAIAVKSQPAIDLLLPLSDLSVRDCFGRTALAYVLMDLACSETLDEGRLALLRELGPPCGMLLDNEGRTPLSEAAVSWGGRDDIFEKVIRELSPHVDLSHRGSDGLTACGAALCFGRDASNIAMLLWKACPDKEAAASEQSSRHGGLAHIAAEKNRADFLAEIAFWADLRAPDSRGRTPLMRAAASGAMGCVEFLAKMGTSLVDHDGCDALMLSIENFQTVNTAKKGLVFCAEKAGAFFRILADGSDFSARDFLGESAMDKARDRGLLWLVKLLDKDNGGDSPPAEKEQSAARAGQAKLQELLHQAAALGDVALVKKRLEQGADPLRSSGESGQTALMAAAMHGQLGAIIKLAPASNLQAVDFDGKTALMAVMASADESLADEPLECIAKLLSPETAMQTCGQGRTPLMMAMRLGKDFAKALEMLGPMSNWMAKDNRGETIASQALGNRQWATAALIIWNVHPDQTWLAASANCNGESLAHLAAGLGYWKMLEAMRDKADFGARDALGRTPLMSACANARAFQRAIAAKMLAPLSDATAVDNDGCDALMLALESGNGNCDDDAISEVVASLISRSNLASLDYRGESALRKAEKRGLSRCAAIIRERMDILAERKALAEAAGPASHLGARQLRI